MDGRPTLRMACAASRLGPNSTPYSTKEHALRCARTNGTGDGISSPLVFTLIAPKEGGHYAERRDAQRAIPERAAPLSRHSQYSGTEATSILVVRVPLTHVVRIALLTPLASIHARIVAPPCVTRPRRGCCRGCHKECGQYPVRDTGQWCDRRRSARRRWIGRGSLHGKELPFSQEGPPGQAMFYE